MPSKPTRKDTPASLVEEPMRKRPSARECSCDSSQFSSGWRRHSDDFRQILQRRFPAIAGFHSGSRRGSNMSGAAFVLQQCKDRGRFRSEEHTSELQSLMRISYAVFCLKKKKREHKV